MKCSLLSCHIVAAEQFREEHPQPSTANNEVPKSAAEYVVPSSVKSGDVGDHVFNDAQSEIRFSPIPKRSLSRVSTRERMTSAGSSASINLGSLSSLLRHASSATSVLQLFSRDGFTANTAVTRTTTTDGGGPPQRIPYSNSSASLHSKFMGGGSMRIANQVTEKGDEQSNVQSVKQPD